MDKTLTLPDARPARPEPEPPSEMEELRQAYASTLPAKLEALATAVGNFSAAPEDAKVLRLATNLAHRLRGTAGSYGFLEASQMGGAVEDLLRAWADADGLQRANLAPQLEALLLRAAAPTRTPVDRPIDQSTVAAVPESRHVHLLLVDEDPSFAERLGGIEGVIVSRVASSEQAIEKIRSGSMNIALIDLHWRGTDGGIQLASELRAASINNPVPLLTISDDNSEEELATAIYLGAIRMLRRSAPVETLSDAIREAIAGQLAARPHVLVLDDDPEFAAFTCTTIESAGMRVTLLDDPTALTEALARETPELLLLDVDMPGINGFDLCRELRTDARWQELSILFLTARTDPSSRVAAFEVGGDDYIPKPVVTVELLARIRARIERWRLLRERADRDALTGLYLRRHFAQTLNAALVECRRDNRLLSLVLLDLDHFKLVNDRHGHLAGDQVLTGFGTLLSRHFRGCDLRGRWGGEEFVLAFPGLAGHTAARVATCALEALRQLEFTADDGSPFHVSFSGGVATFPTDGTTQDALLRVADRRLYDAKSSGRARLVHLDQSVAEGSSTC